MESTLSVSTTTTLTLFTISKALNRHFSKTKSPLLLTRRLTSLHNHYNNNNNNNNTPFPSASSVGALYAVVPQLRRRFRCVSSSAASFGTGGTGFGGGGGGGGGGGSDGGDSKAKLGAEVSPVSPDVIILDVGGMTCGGCAASVKRILESQPQVSSASVNLTTETAVVWPVSEAKVMPNWQKQLGEELAKHLTNCGFNSNFRVAGQGAIEGDISP